MTNLYNPLYGAPANSPVPRSEPDWDGLTAALAGAQGAVRGLMGVLERHQERWLKAVTVRYAAASGLSAAAVLDVVPGTTRLDGQIEAWTLIVDNPSGYILLEPYSMRLIPQACYNYVLTLAPAQRRIGLTVYGGSDTGANTITVLATEGRIWGL